MCNITLYLGDNASGKTRKSIEHALGEKLNRDKLYKGVVTNLPYIKTDNIPDITKRKILEDCDFRTILNSKIRKLGINRDIAESERIINLLELRGNTLLLDEIDSTIDDGSLLLLMNTIADNKEFWDRVIINGHTPLLMEVFKDDNKEIILVKPDGEEILIGEDEAYEYFDSI